MEIDQNQLQIDGIFSDAAEIEPDARTAFLDERCAGLDASIRREVEKLLAADQKALRANLSAAKLNLAEFVATTDAASLDQTEETVGPYCLLQKLGEGGMGVVYMAEQKEPIRRRVAVKLVKPGMDTKQVVARFEAERQALAMMEHPNIAKVFDVGTTELGRPYFVMELVKGVPITKYCDEHQLSIERRLNLFVSVCHAVQHAHQKGVIHRDLKPSNILVAEYGNDSVPKVIDFGLAKAMQQSLTEKTMSTRFDQIVGTYEYMSPEQAKFNQLDIDTRTDVYSLGVLLYELLAGSTPFDSKTLRNAAFDETLRMIREVEPPRPSTKLSWSDNTPYLAAKRGIQPVRLKRTLKGDLDSIVMKALNKERSGRYATSTAFADDVMRYLRQEPVVAIAPSSLYLMSRFLRRHKAITSMACFILLSLLVTTSVITLAWLNSKRLASENAAQVVALKKSEEELRQNAYIHNIGEAYEAWAQQNLKRVHQLLADLIPQEGETDRRGFEWYYLASIGKAELGDVISVADSWSVSPDGKTLASAKNGVVSVFEIEAAGNFGLPDQQKLASEAASIAATSNDSSQLAIYAPDGLRLTNTVNHPSQLLTPDTYKRRAAFSPDGKWVAVGSGASVQISDTTTGKSRWCNSTYGHGNAKTSIKHIGFTSDSTKLITVCRYETEAVVIWDVASGRRIGIPIGWENGTQCAAIHNDETVILGSADGLKAISLKDPESDGPAFWLPDTKLVKSLAINDNQNHLAIGTNRNTVEVWNLEQKRMVLERFCPHPVEQIHLANDGVLLPIENQIEFCRIAPTPTQLASSSFFHWPETMVVDRHEVFVAGADQQIVSSDVETGNHRILGSQTIKHDNNAPAKHPIEVTRCLAMKSDGSALAAAGAQGIIRIMDIASGDQLVTYQQSEKQGIFAIAFSPDGTHLAVGTGNSLEIWNTVTGQVEWKKTRTGGDTATWAVSYSPDGTQLAAAPTKRPLEIWNVQNAEPILVESYEKECLTYALTWAQDGRYLVQGTHDSCVMVYEPGCSAAPIELYGHVMPISTLAFTPDGKTLLSGGCDKMIKLWQVGTWKQTGELAQSDPVQAVRFISARNGLGVVVGTRTIQDTSATVSVDWINTSPLADWTWLQR